MMPTPIWASTVIQNESLLMVREGERIQAPLLCHPKEITAVQNAALTIQYEPGRDWILEDDMLVIPKGSRIPVTEKEELEISQYREGACFPKKGGGYLYFSEGDSFHQKQIAVTYTCEPGQWTGYIPPRQGDRLPNTAEKLTHKRDLTMIIYGDSISEGYNASGCVGVAPQQPAWGELTARYLEAEYHTAICCHNPSKAGMDSKWGLEHVGERVSVHVPDLVFLAFGMNDGTSGRTPEEFAANTEAMMDVIRKASPHVEFVLVAPSLPNPQALTFEGIPFYNQQPDYKEALDTLCRDGVIVANVRDVQRELLKKKRFIDMTGNNINHPNDFFHRVYAQVAYTSILPQ